jgi:protease-4
MSRKTAWWVAAAVAAVAVGAAAVGAVALLVRGGTRSGAVFASGGYLAIDLAGEMPEAPAPSFGGLIESRATSIRGLVEAVDRAAHDGNVKGLLLRLGSLDAGWARVQELRDALVRFKRTGKPSWAHLESPGNLEYLLATGCSKIAVSPTAMLDVSGLAAEVTFYRGTLDKLGIQAQFEGIGKYKNAPNQLTERGFTEPHREQMNALVDGLFDQYVKAIAEGRGLTPEAVRALIDRGPFLAEQAKQAGLVDELLYRDQVEGRVPGGNRLAAAPYVRAGRGGGAFDRRPKLALVYAVGDLVPGESGDGPFGGTAGSDTIIEGLRAARRDASVRGVVLRVDSPGGSGAASDAIWREIQLTRREKPVVASMGDYAASGGFYVAMGADAIVAEPGTITGSIGVFSGKFSLRGLYDKLGISQETVQRGRNANLFSSYEPWSDEQRAKVRALNQSFYDTFVSKAAEGRHKSPVEIERLAQGRVWTGREAARSGLVDGLGGLDEAIRLARQRAHIPSGQGVQLVVLPERKGFFEALLERQEPAVEAWALGRRPASLVRFARALAEGGPIARLPFDLAIR